MDNQPLVLIVVAVLAALAVYFLFFRKKELPPAGKAEERAERPKPPVPEKAAPKPKAAEAEEGAAPEIIPAKPSRPLAEPTPAPGAARVPSEPRAAVEPAAPPPPVVSKKDVAGLRKGLAATRGGFMARLKAIFTGKKEIDPAILEQMEEVMLTSDVGVKTTQAILERLREGMAKNELSDADAVWAALRAEATRILSIGGPRPAKEKPLVVLMVGVNGVGKTTTIGKLATKWSADGKKVVLAAGDTFRAAAVQQLEVWGKRVGAEVVKGKEGADPGAVAFEATKKANEAGADVLLVDTAGRLHTKVNLMEEIKKVKRTIAKAMDGAPHETLLVLDATTGQNALTQAALFKEALELNGLILTKLDGTAKGGVVLGVCDELKVPVRYIGLGERAEDLREFVAADFVEALFGKDDGEAEAA
ncbi:Signal recognition particle receptor protein FtsY [Labilithrix luteola]|uniref:Signal recognition particle receptor FtsY n=1 Tax=Labilithrix luteola TaxID=1391654 RepID=A0A0K1Q2D1_9BACT|nr:signal recognition particle-docking protein FtsY [Labilithrix luteola]AKU99970.1 Signal recognition particle receptor protein FtsY [Labilithrix luteola]